MSRQSNKCAQALKALQEGRHQEALELANRTLDEGDLHGAFIAAVASAGMERPDDFRIYLESAYRATPDLSYLRYLAAYSRLLEDDLEAAIYEWTRIVDLPEGWLAKELLARARKGKDLAAQARQKFSDFYLLPETDEILRSSLLHQKPQPQPQPQSQSQSQYERRFDPVAAPPPKEKINFFSNFINRAAFALMQFFRRRGRGLIISLLVLTLPIGAYFVFKNVSLSQLSLFQDDPSRASSWRDLDLGDHLHVIDPKDSQAPGELKRFLYEYKDKESLGADFELAKESIAEGRVNKARFLLQRIMLSNADFQTKEKSRIFISFIPEPSYQDFSDPLFPTAIMENPSFYTGALVLWQGRTIKFEQTDGGRRLRLQVRDGDKDYIAEAFLKSEEEDSHWRPYEDFQEKSDASAGSEAVIYGKFKGLVGADKIIYLEPIRLWL